MGKRGRPRKTPPNDGIPNYVKQQRKEWELERKMDEMMKLMHLKLMENTLKLPPIVEEGDYLQLKGKMGANNYDINIKTMEDQRMAASLLNQFGIYLIRKDH